MFKRPTISPKLPNPEETSAYMRMADTPPMTIENLAATLLAARAHLASPAAEDANIRAGIFRFVADTALRLVARPSANEAEFKLKVHALMGVSFVNSDLGIARAVQILLTYESRQLGLDLQTTEIHDAPPQPTKLNS